MRSIKARVILILNCISVVTILLSGMFYACSLTKESDRRIENYRRTLMENADREMRVQVETVVSFVERVYADQRAGKLSEAQAKLMAADYIRQLRYDKTGYFCVDSEDGVNVVLRGEGVEGKPRMDSVDPRGKYYVREIIENGRKEGGGYIDLTFARPGETKPLPKRIYSLAFKPYRWIISTAAELDGIEQKVARQRENAAADFRADLFVTVGWMALLQVVVLIVAGYIGRKFAEPMIQATERLKRFAAGDFTDCADSAMHARRDELGEMARASGALRERMNALIRQIVGSAEHVASASAQLTASAEQSAMGSTQVADSIVHLAGASNAQVMSVKSTAEVIEKMSTGMEELASDVVTSNEQIEAAVASAKKGGEDIGCAVGQMLSIETAVRNSADVVSKLGERSKEIGSIVDTISSIAGQTNLLALNAAIEAARAGEHGRGFAVVAEEVRKLAEQSEEAAKQIAALIGEVQADTARAVDAMGEGTKQVQAGASMVSNAGESFTMIASLVNCVEEQSKHMSGVITEMAMDTYKIMDTVREIDQMSKGVASDAETVSAATQEQSATMNEIATASQSLAIMAQELQRASRSIKV